MTKHEYIATAPQPAAPADGWVLEDLTVDGMVVIPRHRWARHVGGGAPPYLHMLIVTPITAAQSHDPCPAEAPGAERYWYRVLLYPHVAYGDAGSVEEAVATADRIAEAIGT